MWQLILTSILLGAGLAMDACAVSMTNGLNEPDMKRGKAVLIAFTFALFQALMPMIGWLCVMFVADKFEKFTLWIPYIAFALLLIIGGKMIYEGVKHKVETKRATLKNDAESQDGHTPAAIGKPLVFAALLVQAVATSIDALSCGFSLGSEDMAGNIWWKALLSVGVIAAVTFVLSLGSVYIGKKFGNKLGQNAEILGGVILIAIGIEIFITGVFF
ncbi:MAG: manganese efflux pump MntP family protein [Corallococcus sp.]|nr:manganese efflux pump MntP family protein [Bacillota bacterium]MCM1534196.1 manganese efflux pump MntP family protein [Corallococcus sp.]